MTSIKTLITIIFLIITCGCGRAAPTDDDSSIPVMATTSIVGDIVQQVGGEHVRVEVLLPLGTDPHSYSPTPNDLSRLADARLIFINGAGLEEFLIPMIESAQADARLVDLSSTIPLREQEESKTSEHTGGDPHTWMDPNNVILWTDIIASALAQADPNHQADYQENAKGTQARLIELDEWVREQVSQIPEGNRRLITDHLVFGYFADRYGFEQTGALIQAFSTLAEPTAQEMAQLEDAILQLNIPVIFVGWTANQNLAERVAEDTGVSIIPLYTHSLSEKGGEADSYQDFIRYNVTAIVAGLK